MKKILAIILCTALTLALCTACAPTETPATPPTEASTSSEDTAQTPAPDAQETTPATAKSDAKYALVLHALNSSFFAKIQEGALAAGEDLGVKVDVMSPAIPNSLGEQVNMIESCIAAGYDGIATVVWDEGGFNDIIKKARDAGITVIGLNMDVPDCGRQSFVGQDNEFAGYQLGKYMFGEVMGGKGKYIIASCAPTNTALISRGEGIARAAAEYPGIEYITLIDIGSDLTGAVGVIENAHLANPDVTAILGVDVFSEAIGTYIQTAGLNGKVYGAGFDLTEGTLSHISKDAMQLTVGQNPFMQGYYSILEAYMATQRGCAPLDINTGALMVTKDNVADVTPE